ncbi:hypothetical protein RW64_10045 [Geobacter sulfurreducens]|nr:hypothetical protein RW64_10045 [Geobacter sulfurreducens]
MVSQEFVLAVLEQMAGAFVSAVEINGMAGEQAAHGLRQGNRGGHQQQMEVIGHERPGKASGAALGEKFRQTGDETRPVVVIVKDVAAFDTADDDVMQDIWYVEAWLAGHGGRVTGVS